MAPEGAGHRVLRTQSLQKAYPHSKANLWRSFDCTDQSPSHVRRVKRLPVKPGAASRPMPGFGRCMTHAALQTSKVLRTKRRHGRSRLPTRED